jgi:hypothetical protein
MLSVPHKKVLPSFLFKIMDILEPALVSVETKLFLRSF